MSNSQFSMVRSIRIDEPLSRRLYELDHTIGRLRPQNRIVVGYVGPGFPYPDCPRLCEYGLHTLLVGDQRVVARVCLPFYVWKDPDDKPLPRSAKLMVEWLKDHDVMGNSHAGTWTDGYMAKKKEWAEKEHALEVKAAADRAKAAGFSQWRGEDAYMKAKEMWAHG